MKFKLILLLICIAFLVSFTGKLFFKQDVPEDIAKKWYLTSFAKTKIDLRNIDNQNSNPRQQPKITDINLKKAKTLDFITDIEPILIVEINDNYRGYPLKMLASNNVLNDIVGDEPILITYSPFTNSAIIYNRRIGKNIFSFNNTGYSLHGNQLLYDKQTHSWWQQFTGEAVVGKMLKTKLEKIPTSIKSGKIIKRNFPNLDIVVNGYRSNHHSLNKYDQLEKPLFFNIDYKSDIPPMSYVIITEDKAFLLSELKEKRELRHEDFTLIWRPGAYSLLGKQSLDDGTQIGHIRVLKNNKGEKEKAPFFISFAHAYKAFYPEHNIIKLNNEK